MGSVLPPSPPTTPNFLVIGAGSRGVAYAQAVTRSTPGKIVAVAEPDPFKREDFRKRYISNSPIPSPGQSFTDWREYVAWETTTRKAHNDGEGGVREGPSITGVFICTLDQTHMEIIQALAPLNLHILCEKPLALSLSDCLTISRSLSCHPRKIFSIGHVLRYSPHNMLLRKLVCDEQVIGEVVSMEHTEPVGYWHFAHSYVRGNWRRSHGNEGVGSLLTKSCHDIDLIMWLLASPSPLTGSEPHLPSTITSHGSLTHFRREKKPAAAKDATNCTDCAHEPDCMYSAPKIYRDKFLREEKDTGWPVKIVVPEIEDIVQTCGWEKAEERLMKKLSEDYDKVNDDNQAIASRAWYGRCVYEADNEVMDDQSVVIAWDDDDNDNKKGRGNKQAIFHMTYPTQAQCERRGRIYGSLGEITYDSHTITVFSFADSPKTTTKVYNVPKNNDDPEANKSHGGGDWGLAGAFVNAVRDVDQGVMDVHEAQWKYVGCDLDECVRSHAVVFAAEDARIGRRVIDWKEWWQRRIGL